MIIIIITEFFSEINIICECAVDLAGTAAVQPLPIYAVSTAVEYCERYLRLLRHEDLDSRVCLSSCVKLAEFSCW